MVLKIYTWVLVIYNILYVGISVTQRNVPLTVSSTLYNNRWRRSIYRIVYRTRTLTLGARRVYCYSDTRGYSACGVVIYRSGSNFTTIIILWCWYEYYLSYARRCWHWCCAVARAAYEALRYHCGYLPRTTFC